MLPKRGLRQPTLCQLTRRAGFLGGKKCQPTCHLILWQPIFVRPQSELRSHEFWPSRFLRPNCGCNCRSPVAECAHWRRFGNGSWKAKQTRNETSLPPACSMGMGNAISPGCCIFLYRGLVWRERASAANRCSPSHGHLFLRTPGSDSHPCGSLRHNTTEAGVMNNCALTTRSTRTAHTARAAELFRYAGISAFCIPGFMLICWTDESQRSAAAASK